MCRKVVISITRPSAGRFCFDGIVLLSSFFRAGRNRRGDVKNGWRKHCCGLHAADAGSVGAHATARGVD